MLETCGILKIDKPHMPDTVFLWLFAVGGIAALAADPGVMAKSGRAFKVADLAVEYGFTDPGTDGGGVARRRPRYSAAFTARRCVAFAKANSARSAVTSEASRRRAVAARTRSMGSARTVREI